MSVDPISISLTYYPDQILREKAIEVDVADQNVHKVATRMIEMMFEHEGVGLAAPQVGLPWRLFVTRDPENEDNGVVWLNPTLHITCDELEAEEEGCLSIPDIRCDVKRPIGIRISGWDATGAPIEMESDQFIARIWQHENDHLDGILILDKMNAMDRIVNRRQIKYLERAV